MAMDPTPWAPSTPGAVVSATTARILAFAATGGDIGVIGSSSMRVRAQTVPNGTVTIAPGVATTVLGPYDPQPSESYVMHAPTPTTLQIPAAGSSGTRSMWVIAEVDDAGRTGQTPDDPVGYQYARFRVVDGMAGLDQHSELTQANPFVLLAKIDLPANTGTVTNAHITDLRQVVNGRERLVTRAFADITRSATQTLTSDATYPTGQYFPRVGGAAGNAVHTIRVPEWATRMEIRAEWLSVAVEKSGGNGHMWVTWDTVVKNDPAYYTQGFRWSSEDTTQRQNWVAVQEVPVHMSLRGRDVHFALRANRDPGSTAAGRCRMDIPSAMNLQVRFLERAD